MDKKIEKINIYIKDLEDEKRKVHGLPASPFYRLVINTLIFLLQERLEDEEFRKHKLIKELSGISF